MLGGVQRHTRLCRDRQRGADGPLRTVDRNSLRRTAQREGCRSSAERATRPERSSAEPRRGASGRPRERRRLIGDQRAGRANRWPLTRRTAERGDRDSAQDTPGSPQRHDRPCGRLCSGRLCRTPTGHHFSPSHADAATRRRGDHERRSAEARPRRLSVSASAPARRGADRERAATGSSAASATPSAEARTKTTSAAWHADERRVPERAA